MSDEAWEHDGQAAAWLLGMLPSEEALRFEAHLAGCESCRAEIARLKNATDALADSAMPESAPPELRARVLAEVEAEAALFHAAQQPDPAPASSSSRPWRKIAMNGFVAVSLLALGVLIGSTLTTTNTGSRVRTVRGSVTPAGGGSAAGAAVLVGGRAPQLVLTDVAAPPTGRVYQAWVVGTQRATPTGVLFSVPRSGDTKISLPPLKGVKSVIVTAEPPRGSRTPTPPPVVSVRLPRN